MFLNNAYDIKKLRKFRGSKVYRVRGKRYGVVGLLI